MTADRSDFGAVVVGASLAGCTTATLLARAGVRVALVERGRDAEAFKRVCGHYIQASAVPTLERLGLMESIEAAGGVRSHGRLWTRWGAIDVPPGARLTRSVNLRRERRLPEFKRDPAAALEAFIADLPDAPPIGESRRVSPVIGKIKMPNVRRGPIGASVALVGDAALATDPLWGVGCGWAFQSGEWLADSVAAALHGDEPLARGLRRYRRRFRRRLGGHSFLIDDYATGRRFNAVERLLYSAGASDKRVAARLLRFGTRSIGPMRLAPAAGRAMLVSARRPPPTTPIPARVAFRR